MSYEASPGPSGTSDDGGHRSRGGSECSPLQARAAFLKNWDWQSIVGINERTCRRGGSQHGVNSETGDACAAEWRLLHQRELSLSETFDALRAFHRKAPFLFLNGNTFSFVGRELTLALFSDLPPLRKREAASAIAHYIAGVLGREEMTSLVDELARSADLIVGTRVRTLKGSLRGVVVRLLEDGRVAWRPDGAAGDLLCLPESLTAAD